MITVMDKLKAFKSKLRHCQKLSISFSGGRNVRLYDKAADRRAKRF